jgi:hypothetical protein
MKSSRILSFAIKELSHQKVILAAWYNFLKEENDAGKLASEEFIEFLRASVVYDLDKDQIELVLSGSEELLEKFHKSIFKS